jgi:hypothetical protein
MRRRPVLYRNVAQIRFFSNRLHAGVINLWSQPDIFGGDGLSVACSRFPVPRLPMPLHEAWF